MNGWKLVKPLEIKQCDVDDNFESVNAAKVKITKSLLTLSDVLVYDGEIEAENVVMGSSGVGIITEASANLFEIEKGKRVFVEPTRPCNECYNCMSNQTHKCSNLLMAGEDFDGFLRDFVSADSENIHLLPDSITDLEALFVGHVSLALSIVDKLEIKKGEYVAIIGSDSFAVILAQILIYYQAVPIIIGENKEELNIAKKSGIYYVFDLDDNYMKEVFNITGGRLAKKAVYLSDSDISVSKAFSVSSFNASVAFTGTLNKNVTASFSQAVKKQLNIFCVNNGYGNTESSINLIANNAIDISNLEIRSAKFSEVPDALDKMENELRSSGKVHETVINLF